MPVASSPATPVPGPSDDGPLPPAPTVPAPRSPASELLRSPRPTRPMRASAGALPRGPGWAFEFVWDGLRCFAQAGGGSLRLLTDAGRDVTSSFPELGVLAAHGGRGLVLDGVVVALDPVVGRPDAGRLRRRHRVAHPSTVLQARTPVSLFVFDVLEVDGRSTVRLPYHARRSLLAGLDLSGSAVVVPPSFSGVTAGAVLHTARHYGIDGVLAKRVESTYQAGRRSRSWIETPVHRHQDVLVGGWVPGPRSPDGVGALLVGVPVAGGLRYVGRVSTGITAAARHEFAAAASGLERTASPFDGPLPEETRRQAHWVAPRLVGQVEHRRWTVTGLLERPAWCGLQRGTHPAAVQAPVLAAPVVDLDLALDDLEPADRPGAIMPTMTEVVPAPTAPAPSPRDHRLVADAGEAALRSRFSQHFVHNTLTAIAAYVRTDPGRARDLLTEFADFTRYSFRSGGDLSTVAEELGNAERYLTLEQARFGRRLVADVTVGPEVADVALPPFVIAPLVENAVRHGIEPVPGGGAVSVVATGVGGDCVITVSDDGAGMTPEQRRTSARVDTARGGLAEVGRRLEEAFGDAGDLHVDTRPGAGTSVRVRVPVRDRAAAR